MIINSVIGGGGSASAFTITSSAGSNGSISPTGTTAVLKGGAQTYTITPNPGYAIQSVLVDGVSQGAISSYTFNNVQADHTISVTFKIQYTVSASVSGGNGTVSVSPTVVDSGGSSTVTCAPNTGYRINTLTVNGTTVTPTGNQYVISNIQSNQAVVVTYTKITYTITVTQSSNGTISPGTSTVEYGSNKTFTITPSTGYDIATLKIDGTAVTVASSYTFSSVTSNHTITATYSIKTYAVTCSVSGSTGGTISASPNPVNHGSSTTITCSPSAGYYVSSLVVNGTEVKSSMTGNTYVLSNVTSAATAVVTYTKYTYTITVTQGSNGTISPGTSTVEYGTNKTFSITPATGYNIASVTVDGVSQGAISSYTFTNVTANHTITATYSIKTYAITVTQGSNGTISPGTTNVNHGSNQSFSITPSTGYNVSNVVVDGTSVGAVTSYTFSNVTANHTITASFVIQTFTITVTQGSNGTISPGTSTVNYGSNKAYSITADSGYEVDTVTVDGVSQGAVTSYTFSSVVANHTITASYKESGPTAETHTFTINKTTLQTSPTTCVEYESGYSAAQAYAWIMTKLHPSVVKNGTVNYFLNPANLAQKLDGTASNLTGADGDVMVSIDPLWWKVTANTSSALTIQISDAPISGGGSAHLFNGTIRKYLHLGMFEMSYSAANSVYSTSATPWVSMTNDTARTTAESKGDTYSSMTGLTWALYQMLCVFTSGSTDCQTTIGQGLTGGSSVSAIATSAMLTANGYTSATKTSATTALMYLFVAHPWGNVAQWICGFKSHSSTWAIINDQKQARGVAVGDNIPSTWTTLTFPGGSGSYQIEAQGVNAAPLFGKTKGGSSSTYYCDNLYASTSTYRCAFVGGYYNYGTSAGVFYVYAVYGASYANDSLGSRLQCLDTSSA